jgi:hypothetical protein
VRAMLDVGVVNWGGEHGLGAEVWESSLLFERPVYRDVKCSDPGPTIMPVAVAFRKGWTSVDISCSHLHVEIAKWR